MKNSKLIEIFNSGNIVIPIFLLRNYKKFHLEMDEFIFLMYLYHLGDKIIFDPNKYSEVLNIDLETVMNYIGGLTEKGFVRVEIVKNDKGLMEEVVLLEDFFQKISLMMMEDEEEEKKIDSSIFDLIEQEFGRTLGPIEIEIIKAWLDSNMKEEIIREAIKEAVLSGVANLRYIDKILYEWGKAGIQTVQDVEEMRKKRNNKVEKENDIDMDIVDWNWFDEDE